MTAGSLRGLARVFENVASASLIVMMLVTVLDVLLRNFSDRPMTGAVEIVRITMAYLVFMAIPQTFLKREHVQVDVLDHLVSRQWVLRLNVIGEIGSLVLLAVMLWVMWGEAVDSHELGDVTSDLMVPLIVLWVPMLVGAACAIGTVMLLMIEDLKQLAQEGS